VTATDAVEQVGAREALDALRAVVGDDHLLTDTAARATFEQPWRGAAGSALAVARPADVEELRGVVRVAVAHGIPLVLQGANTGLVGAGVPDGTGRQVVVSLTRLDRIRELDVVDRTVVVEAGRDRESLDQALAEYDLELPVDLGASPSIGGMVATNTGGARMLRHGDMRRRTLGVEVVVIDADATLLSDLGALRKDNGRLHLHDLVVGGDGRRGIVTAAAIEVELRPATRTTALLVPSGVDAVMHVLDVFERGSGHALSAFEVMSDTALGWVRAALPAVADPFPAGAPALTVLVELSDRDASRDLEGLLLRLGSELAASGHLLDALVVPPRTAWTLRHSLSEAAALCARARGRRIFALDVSVRRSRLPALIAELERVVSDDTSGRDLDGDLELGHFGHWGDGGAHLLLSMSAGATEHDISSVRRELHEVVAAAGGSFSAEHGIGPHNLASYLTFVPAWQRDLESTVQRLFDPCALLGHVSAGPTT
jgi:FAD/FMN-containing dehydrogenase